MKVDTHYYLPSIPCYLGFCCCVLVSVLRVVRCIDVAGQLALVNDHSLESVSAFAAN